MASTARTVSVVLLVLAVAHAFALLALPRLVDEATAVDLTWGFRHVLYLPPLVAALAYALALVLVGPPSRARLHDATALLIGSRLLVRVRTAAARHPRAATAGLALAALAAFVLFDTKHALLGDAFRRPQNVEAYLVLEHEAGAMHLLHWTYRALHAAFGFDGRATVELVSQLSGIVFVVAGIGLARRLGRDGTEIAVIAALTLLAGAVQIFFGYVESYGPVFATLALYLLAAVSYAQGRASIGWPLLALGLAIAFHAAAAAFAPSLVTALAVRRRRHARRPTGRTLAAAVTAAGLVGAVALWWVVREAPAMMLPLSPDPSYGTTLFSLVHLREVVNAQLLASGVALPLGLVLVVVAARARRLDAETLVLLTAAGVALVEMFVFDARLGRADWDITALPSLAVQPLAALLLVRTVPRAELSRVALPVIAFAVLHTVPWIALNATDRAAARFTDILVTDPGSYYLRQPGGLIAARTLDDNGLEDHAREAAARAYDRHPDDPRCAYAYAYLLAGVEGARATEVLRETVRRTPGYLPAYGLLAELEAGAGATREMTDTLLGLYRLYERRPAMVLRAYPAAELVRLFARLRAQLLARGEAGAAAAAEVDAALSRLGGRPEP